MVCTICGKEILEEAKSGKQMLTEILCDECYRIYKRIESDIKSNKDKDKDKDKDILISMMMKRVENCKPVMPYDNIDDAKNSISMISYDNDEWPCVTCSGTGGCDHTCGNCNGTGKWSHDKFKKWYDAVIDNYRKNMSEFNNNKNNVITAIQKLNKYEIQSIIDTISTYKL